MNLRLLILGLPLFAACTNGGDTILQPDPADAPSTSPLVTVVYDPDGLGDRSYR